MIKNIINILQLPVISIKNTNINTINELYNYISNLTIDNIENFFLNNEIQKEDFLKLSKEFLNSSS
jgi:ethanolamine ammonia-lyase large subunit